MRQRQPSDDWGYLLVMPTLPINAEILTWAMRDLGIGVEQVASSLGRETSLVDEWLAGSKKPFKGDVEKMASLLGRSTQFFFRTEPPASSPAGVKYRASVLGTASNPEQELRVVRQAQHAQKLVRFWAQERGQRAHLPVPTDIVSAATFAVEARAFHNWDVTEQISASSKTQVFKKLRLRLETAGLSVLLTPMGADNCRGFSLPDPVAPLIAINSDYKLASLRSFTLLHELAHVAKGVSAVCHDPVGSDERWCDQFAADFLLPEPSVRAYFERKKWSFIRLNDLDNIRLISNRYGTSYQAVALRLRGLGLTEQAVVDAVFRYSGEDEGKTGFAPGGKKVYEKRFDEFGSTYTRAVLNLRQSNQITEIESRKRLRVTSGKDVGLLAQHARENS